VPSSYAGSEADTIVPDVNDRPFIIWTDTRRPEPVTHRAPAFIGGPDQATFEGAETIDDLSQTLRSASGSDILLASRAPETTLEWLESRGSLADLKKRDNRIVSVEPIPTSVLSGALQDDADRRALPLQAPLLRHAALAAALRDALANFGSVQTALVAARDDGSLGSLGARLADALDLLGELFGEPESVDASVASPRGASGVRAALPDDLSLLRGSLTAHLRFETGASAVLSLSDQAGRWFRGLTLAGEGGLIRFDDHGFEWIGPDGVVIEQTDAPKGEPRERLARFLSDGAFEAPPPTPEQRARTLASGGACVLSARTGQPESPATVRRMANLVS